MASQQFLGLRLVGVGTEGCSSESCRNRDLGPRQRRLNSTEGPERPSLWGLPFWQSYTPHLKKMLRGLKPSIWKVPEDECAGPAWWAARMSAAWGPIDRHQGTSDPKAGRTQKFTSKYFICRTLVILVTDSHLMKPMWGWVWARDKPNIVTGPSKQSGQRQTLEHLQDSTVTAIIGTYTKSLGNTQLFNKYSLMPCSLSIQQLKYAF